MTAWPIGYPVLIAVVMKILNLSAFWASKIVNLICLGLIMLVLRQIDHKKAWLLALYFGTCIMSEIFSYTWSESLFILLLLLFYLNLYKYLFTEQNKKNLFYLFVTGSLLFATKYIGLFSILILIIIALITYKKKYYLQSFNLLIPALGILGFIVLYLFHNYMQSDLVWGGDRVYPQPNMAKQIVLGILKAFINEINFYRHYYFKGPFDFYFLITLLIQILWFSYIYVKFLKGKVKSYLSKIDNHVKLMVLFSSTYLATLFCLRLLSPFDAFYFRLLAPSSMFICLAILLILTKENTQKANKILENHIVLFLLSSLLFQLHKSWLLSFL